MLQSIHIFTFNGVLSITSYTENDKRSSELYRVNCLLCTDRMGLERTGTPFLFFFWSLEPERRSSSFSRRRTLYLLLFNTRFLFLRSVRCALHVAHQPHSVIKRPLAQFSEKSYRLTLVDQDFARIQKTFIVFVVLVPSIGE